MKKILVLFLFPFVLCSNVKELSLSDLKQHAQITEEDIDKRVELEIRSFLNIYHKGYYEGNPLDSQTRSTFDQPVKYQGALVDPIYLCYAECIRPFVEGKNVLEIGPGRGAWTKAIIAHNPKSVVCIDVLSAEHNQFWEYVGAQENVTYHQISNLFLDEILDDSVDYVFSFGVFCHISPLLVERYFKYLHKKLRKGAQCFILYADFDKYNAFSGKYNKPWFLGREDEILLYKEKKVPRPGQWYHLGINRAKELLINLGYQVVSSDLEINERDPMIYFIKP